MNKSSQNLPDISTTLQALIYAINQTNIGQRIILPVFAYVAIITTVYVYAPNMVKENKWLTRELPIGIVAVGIVTLSLKKPVNEVAKQEFEESQQQINSRIQAYIQVGKDSLKVQSFNKAQESFEEAFNIADRFDRHQLKIECHRYLAETYYYMRDIPKAYEQAKQALLKNWELAGNPLDNDIRMVLRCTDELSNNHEKSLSS